jgi:hypothetical protein
MHVMKLELVEAHWSFMMLVEAILEKTLHKAQSLRWETFSSCDRRSLQMHFRKVFIFISPWHLEHYICRVHTSGDVCFQNWSKWYHHEDKLNQVKGAIRYNCNFQTNPPFSQIYLPYTYNTLVCIYEWTRAYMISCIGSLPTYPCKFVEKTTNKVYVWLLVHQK